MIPRVLRLSLAPDVWLSIPSKSGGNYCGSISENPGGIEGSHVTWVAYQGQYNPLDPDTQLSQNSYA